MEVALQTSLDLRRCTRFISLLAGFSVVVLNATGVASYYALSAIVFGALFGASLGAIPGSALIWLLRQSLSSNVEDLATAH